LVKTQAVCRFGLQPHVCKSLASLRTRGPLEHKLRPATTSGDPLLKADRLERLLQRPLHYLRQTRTRKIGEARCPRANRNCCTMLPLKPSERLLICMISPLPVFPSCPYSVLLFKRYFCHHALVFMTQQMTMEQRHAAYYGVGKVHYEVNRAVHWNIDCIQPFGRVRLDSVFCIRQEMDLMNVEGRDLTCRVHDSPVLHGADRRRIRNSVEGTEQTGTTTPR